MTQTIKREQTTKRESVRKRIEGNGEEYRMARDHIDRPKGIINRRCVLVVGLNITKMRNYEIFV